MTFSRVPGLQLPALAHYGLPAAMPVSIDYSAALALRQMALEHGDYPDYLLAVEVVALLQNGV